MYILIKNLFYVFYVFLRFVFRKIKYGNYWKYRYCFKRKKIRRLCLKLEKTKQSKEVATGKNVDEVEKNDDLMKNLLIKDLNSDERDFAIKDLTDSQLDYFFHALTQWELATSY